MALLAESLVEEWLNRQGFFTIRGVKHGVHEVDLLGIHRKHDGSIEGWHVEVQVSFRPVGYISKLTNDIVGASITRLSRSSAKRRSAEEIEACGKEWVQAKFVSTQKRQVREKLWPGISWSNHFVHGVVKDDRELDLFRGLDVTCHPFDSVLSDLLRRGKGDFSGSAGGDIAEIVDYYNRARVPR